MQYRVDFGTLARAARPAAAGRRFRLAVLGDFSGRANAGTLDGGDALARRKPIPVDVDNLDDVLARQQLRLALPLGEADATVAVPIGSMDDFHPDQLVENVELFESLLDLRRNLRSKAGFARAAKEVMSWSDAEALPRPPASGRGSAVDPGLKLSDFARLTGRKPTGAEPAEVDELVRRLVGPFVQPAKDPQADALTAQVDAALSAAMRRVLHHPDFQAAEALWRAVELLVRRCETGARLQIVLYDVTADEWAADLAGSDDLEQSGLYRMLVEQPALDADQGAISAVVGLYGVELSPPHADLLGRMAQVAAAGGFPFVTAIEPDALQTPMHEQHPLIRDAWGALQALPASRYLGLSSPRFLLRMPYGKRSDPIDSFPFEEFTRQSGLSGMVWANGAAAVGLLLAQAWSREGASMKPGSPASIGDVPFYVYVGPDGDQVALPCTERLWGERQVARAAAYGILPLVSLRGRPEIRLAGTASVAGGPLAGFWDPVSIAPASAPNTASPAPAPAEPEAEPDIDAMLATLAADSPADAPEPEPEPEAPPEAEEEVDLDALLASLSEEPPPAAENETEVDLDALLASL